MAEFVRIWDETAQDYVEYDTTIVESETVYVPVSNISISRPINAGTVNKVIDTNDIIKRFQALEVSQIQKFITVEKSDANRFSIERSNAKSINVESSRNSIIVNTSGKGQKGEKGETGRDSVLNFIPNGVYELGRVVSIEGRLWLARVDLDGSITPLANPTEGTQWTEVASYKSLRDLPLVSGYEISNQADWNIVEPIIEFGDLVRISSESEELTLDLFNETEPFQTTSVGKPLADTNGNEFFIVGSGDNGVISVQGSNFSDVVAQDFIDALNSANIVFGEDKFSGNNTIIQTRSAFGTGGTVGIQILSVSLTSTDPSHILTVGVADENGSLAVSSIIALSTPIGENPEGRLFDNVSPGIEIGSTITDLVVGDNLYVEGEEGQTLQTIINVVVLGGRTYYEVENYTGFESGSNIIGRIITNQTLTTDLWYVRNENIESALDKLDILSNDPKIVEEIDAIKLLGDGVTDPRFINEFARDRATTFFGTNDTVTNPERFEQPDQSRIKILYNRLFGGTNIDENGTGYSSSSITDLGGSTFLGVQDGSQVNAIDSVEADGVLSIDSKVLSSTAEVNKIDGVTGVLSISSDGSRILSTSAEVNKINTVDETTGSILDLDTNTSSSTYRQLSAIKASGTGGTGEGNKLILLNSDGVIPSTAITQVNLSSVTIFETISDRNASTDTTWSTGDTAIVSGIPGLFLATDPFTIGGTTLLLDSTDDLPSAGQINLRFGDNFKRVNFTANDTTTDTLTVDSGTFVTGDITKFTSGLLGTAITTATGTFVYKSSDQTTGQTTTNSDWAEIVPTGGVVTSVNGASGVVTLGVANINGLDTALGTKVDTATNSRLGTTVEFTQITTNETSIGEPDRTATAQDIADAAAETPPRTITSETVITGSGLEKAIADEIINRGTADTTITSLINTNTTAIGEADRIADADDVTSGDATVVGETITGSGLEKAIADEIINRGTADTTLQGNIDGKQDNLTDGVTTDQLLKWDGDSWEPGNVEFSEYSSSKTYSVKDITTIEGRVGLGATMRLVIRSGGNGAFNRLRLSEDNTVILDVFGNNPAGLENADGPIAALAAGTPGSLSNGGIRIFPGQSADNTAADLASILPHSFSLRNITNLTVNYLGGNIIYITKSTDIGDSLTQITTGSFDVTWGEFNERGIDATIWFAKRGSTGVTPGTDNNTWRQLDNQDEVSEYDSTRTYSAKDLVTIGREGLGEVIRLKINTPQSGDNQQLDLRESTFGGRFIQVFSNNQAGLTDADGAITLAPGTPGAFANSGSIRISAGQTATAVASDLASILPYSWSTRNVTGFTVHYFGGDTIFISKDSDIGTLTTQAEGGDWDTTFDKFEEPGIDIKTFISLKGSNSVSPGTDRSAWGNLNTVNDDGDIELLDDEAGIILRNENGDRYKITVDISGNLESNLIT